MVPFVVERIPWASGYLVDIWNAVVECAGPFHNHARGATAICRDMRWTVLPEIQWYFVMVVVMIVAVEDRDRCMNC